MQPQAHQVLFETNGFLAEMCIEEESLLTAFNLRYQAYQSVGAIPEDPSELFSDVYDSQQNARTFLIWENNQPIASVRSFTWSADYDWEPTPTLSHFKKDVEKHLGSETPLLDSNRYVTAPSVTGRKSLTAQMLLFRIQTLGALIDQCAYVITAVRPNHVKFYKRLMNFYPISEAIEISEVKFPIQLLATPIASKDALSQNSPIAKYEEADLERYHDCLTRLKEISQ